MSKKAVTVTLWSQRTGEEPVELTAAGTLEVRGDGAWTLCYEEEDAQKSIVTVEPQRVTVERQGAIRYQMVFETGRRHSGQYETPYGALEMTVVTHSLEQSMAEEGALSVTYHLILGGAETARTQLRLTAR